MIKTGVAFPNNRVTGSSDGAKTRNGEVDILAVAWPCFGEHSPLSTEHGQSIAITPFFDVPAKQRDRLTMPPMRQYFQPNFKDSNP